MPDYRYHAENWPPLRPPLNTGIAQLEQYALGGTEMLDRAFVAIDEEAYMQPYRFMATRLSTEPPFHTGSEGAKGLRRGYTAGVLAVQGAGYVRQTLDDKQLLDNFVWPESFNDLTPTGLAGLVKELSRYAWQDYELEIRSIYDCLRCDEGPEYFEGAQVGLGYFVQRYDVAWRKWRLGAIARIEADVCQATDWDSILPH